MKSHASLVAQQTRLREWAELVRDCQNRPQGMKIDEWCQLHDIMYKSLEMYRVHGKSGFFRNYP